MWQAAVRLHVRSSRRLHPAAASSMHSGGMPDHGTQRASPQVPTPSVLCSKSDCHLQTHPSRLPVAEARPQHYQDRIAANSSPLGLAGSLGNVHTAAFLPAAARAHPVCVSSGTRGVEHIWARCQPLVRHAHSSSSCHAQEVTGVHGRASVVWQNNYHQLAEFVHQHRRLPRPRSSSRIPLVDGEIGLNLWCREQRKRWAGEGGHAPLSPSQESALEAIPRWYWVHGPTWEDRYEELNAFVRRHGRLPINQQMQPEARSWQQLRERRLWRWCVHQRQVYRGSVNNVELAARQIAALEAVPGWWWAQFTCPSWEEQYNQVVEYVEKHGRLPRTVQVPDDPAPEEIAERRLGLWCKTQRQVYRLAAGKQLTPQQVAALEAVPGWVWEHYRVVPWEDRYKQLVEFVDRHGRLPAALTWREGLSPEQTVEAELGRWCTNQRQVYRQHFAGRQQTPQQVAALEAVPGWVWEHHTIAPWHERCRQVAEFVEQHGRLPRILQVPDDPAPEEIAERRLGKWCSQQRVKFKAARCRQAADPTAGGSPGGVTWVEAGATPHNEKRVFSWRLGSAAGIEKR